MEQQLAELQRRLAESEARAREEQRLREEEQHLREEEERKSKQAEARANEEQRLREEEQQRREAVEAVAEQSQPTNLTEYLEACHHFSLALEVVMDKTSTTRGDTTKPFGRLFPQRIVPWDDFPLQQKEVWEKLSKNKRFTSERVFPSTHQLDYVRKYLDPISSEIGLRHFARDTVENPVRTFIEEIYKDEQLRGQFQLHDPVIFESHTNLGGKSEAAVEEQMEDMSITGPISSRRRGKKKTKRGNQHNTKSDGKRRAGDADQYCIYKMSDGARLPVISIEYKAPHKFPLAEIIAGLDGEIRPADELINKEGDDFEFLSKSLVAAVITQLFSAMIGKGTQLGYIFVGEAIIFLHIQDDPATVYYHLSIPRLDFQDDDDNRFHRTSVAQVSAFVLTALTAEVPGQSWHDAAARLDTWDVEYIDILKKIPETTRKSPPLPSLYKAAPWKGFHRSPIRTRSRHLTAACKPSNDNVHTDEDNESDGSRPSTPTPDQNARQRVSQSKPKTPPKKTGRSSESHGSPQHKVVATSRPRIEDRPYCTQQCLLGLASGGAVDNQCPNSDDHQGKHLELRTFLQLIRVQLARDRGRDADCKPLYVSGSRGALVKIRLSTHGYTLVAKAMKQVDRRHLLQEAKVYGKLRLIQGIYIPVCLGRLELELPYYYDSGTYASMLLLSWAGRPLCQYLKPENKARLLNEATKALEAVHRHQVLHKDVELRNWLWDEQRASLMLVDFERAEIRAKQPLSTISPNRKRNRLGEEKWAAEDVFDREIRSARYWMSQSTRWT